MKLPLAVLAFTLAWSSISWGQTTSPATQPSSPPQGAFRVATCQFPVGSDVHANAEWIRRQMRAAREQGAEVAHFPECALPGYAGADLKNLEGYDWDLLRRETDSIRELAGELKMWVLLGSMHRLTPPNKPHNCVYVIGPAGRLVDRYDKRFCTRADLRHYSPGDHPVTFEINGVKCGVLVCYELGFQELYREYYKLGVQVVFHSFYNARSPKNRERFAELAPLLGRAAAGNNHMFISMSNSSGPDSWPACFVRPDAMIAGRLKTEEPGIMINDVDLSQVKPDDARPLRLRAMEGILHSGTPVDDERSRDRQSY